MTVLVAAACGRPGEPSGAATPHPPTPTPVRAASATPLPQATPSAPSALAPPTSNLRGSATPTPTLGNEPSLKAIVESQGAFLTSGATMNLLPSMSPALVALEYTAEFRPLPPETGGFLWQYGDSFGEDLRSQVDQELLIRDGGDERWMPVLNAFVPTLTSELEAGDEMMVYVRLLGSLQTDEGYRMIFVISGGDR